MTQFQSFCLYVDTALIIIFLFVYIFRGNKKDSGEEQPAAPVTPVVPHAYSDESAVSQMAHTGISEGDIRLSGVDDEDLPVILAVISAASNTPISALKVKSISRI